MVNIVNGHDLDTQSGRADFRAGGGWVEGNSNGGYDYQGPGGQTGHGGGTQAPSQGAVFNTGGGNATGGSNVSGPQQQQVQYDQKLAQGINSLLGAIASGNKEAFDEAVRQFNLEFGLDKDKFAEDTRRYNENLAVSVAGLTGSYQGNQTLQAALQAANIAAQQAGLTGYYTPPSQGQQQLGSGNMALDNWNKETNQAMKDLYLSTRGGNLQTAQNDMWRDMQGAIQQAGYASPQVYLYGQDAVNAAAARGPGTPVQTLAANQQAYNQAMGMINQAAQLQANPFRQAQAIGQMQQMLAGRGVSTFQAPNTQVPNGASQWGTPAPGNMGWDMAGRPTAAQNPAGGAFSGMNNLQALIDDIRGGPQASNSIDPNQTLAQIPTPNKVNSVEFLRMTPQGQNMILSGIQQKYGIEPTDALAQIKATMPTFNAPTTFGAVRR